MTKEDIRKKAFASLQRARQHLRQSSFSKKSQGEAGLIAAVRKTREELWEAKLAARS